MPFNGASSNFFHEGLKLISYCPVCNNRYEQVEAKILEEHDESYLIYLKCRNCSSSVVALVMTGMLGVTSVGLVTDLNSEEVIKFKQAKNVTADEVIAIHQLLGEDKEITKKLMD